jgi:hypothetical protein
LTVSYAGLVNGDTAAALTTPPTLSTTANSAAPIGFYVITADGAVDPDYAISYVDGTLNVALESPGITLVTSAAASVYAQPVTFTATVSGTQGTATGSVQFEVDGVDFNTPVRLSGRIAVLTTTGLSAGSHAIAAFYLSDSTVYTDSSTTMPLTENVSQASQSITFGPLSPARIGVGPITLTATSSSGLPVDFSVISGPGSISGNTLTVLGVGSIVVDADQAGNANFTAAALMQQIMLLVSPLTVTSIAPISPNPRSTSLSSIDVTFSAPVNTGSLTAGALNLTDDGSTNLINAGVTLTLVPGTTSTYAIGGLSSLTTAQGEYTLNVNSADIQDQNGVTGINADSTSWLMDLTLPTSHVINSLGTSQSSDTFSLSVTYNDPTGPASAPPSGVATLELFVSVNNGAFSLYQTMNITPVASGTATFTFAGRDRNMYAFHSIAIDAAGNTESKNSNTIEASTSVPDLNPPVTHVLATSAYNDNGMFTLNWSGTDPDRNSGTPAGSIALVDIYVEVDGGSPTLISQVSAGTPNAGGVYGGTLTYAALADGAPHTYGFFTVGVDDLQKKQYAPAAGPTSPDVTFRNITYSSPLAVENLAVEDGLSERTFIRYLDVNFNQTAGSSAALAAPAAGLAGDNSSSFVELIWFGENVTASTVPVGVNLFGAGTTASVGLSGNDLSINLGANGITSLLPGGSGATSPLKTYGDGWYLLGIDPTGNASNHQIFWEPFFRLLGDTSGDGVVTGAYTTAGTDAYAVYHAEGQSGNLLNADVNGDGAVNSKDLSVTIAAKGDAVGAGPLASNDAAFQLLAGAAGPGKAVAVTQSQVQALLPEAISAWQAAGLDAADVRRLDSVRIQVGALGTNILGLETAGVIAINQTAARDNWYVGPGSPPTGRIDLLTVLEHELGHVIGLSDNDQAGDLMDETLATGARRSPTRADLPLAAQAPSIGMTTAAIDAALPALVGDHLAGLAATPPRNARIAQPSVRHAEGEGAVSSRFPIRFRRPGQVSARGIKPKGSPE